MIIIIIIITAMIIMIVIMTIMIITTRHINDNGNSNKIQNIHMFKSYKHET